jgi:hypothetical protein
MSDTPNTDDHGNPFGTVYVLRFPGSIIEHDFVDLLSYQKLERELAAAREQIKVKQKAAPYAPIGLAEALDDDYCQPFSAVPKDMVMVPVEPTLDMLHAGALILANHQPSAIGLANAYEIYKAMLNAAKGQKP